MANSTLLRTGSVVPQFAQTLTINPTSINSNSISTETFTVTGLQVDAQVYVDAPNLEAGLFILGGICVTVNVLTLSIWNSTNAAIDPASQGFRISQF